MLRISDIKGCTISQFQVLKAHFFLRIWSTDDFIDSDGSKYQIAFTVYHRKSGARILLIRADHQFASVQLLSGLHMVCCSIENRLRFWLLCGKWSSSMVKLPFSRVAPEIAEDIDNFAMVRHFHTVKMYLKWIN